MPFSAKIVGDELVCERRSKSAARGGVARPVEECSAQLCSDIGEENRGGAAISPLPRARHEECMQTWRYGRKSAAAF